MRSNRVVVLAIALALSVAAPCGAEELPSLQTSPLQQSIARAIERAANPPTSSARLAEAEPEGGSEGFWNSTNTTLTVFGAAGIVGDLEFTYRNIGRGPYVFDNPDHPGWIAFGEFREGNWFGKHVIPHGRWVSYPAFVAEKAAVIYGGHWLRKKGDALKRNPKKVVRILGHATWVAGYALPTLDIGGQIYLAWENYRWPNIN